jgi:hypothetical protein
LNPSKVITFCDIPTTLKHHVFKKVSEAAATLLLIARSHVVGHANSDRGRAVILVQDNSQAIGEFVLVKL